MFTPTSVQPLGRENGLILKVDNGITPSTVEEWLVQLSSPGVIERVRNAGYPIGSANETEWSDYAKLYSLFHGKNSDPDEAIEYARNLLGDEFEQVAQEFLPLSNTYPDIARSQLKGKLSDLILLPRLQRLDYFEMGLYLASKTKEFGPYYDKETQRRYFSLQEHLHLKWTNSDNPLPFFLSVAEFGIVRDSSLTRANNTRDVIKIIESRLGQHVGLVNVRSFDHFHWADMLSEVPNKWRWIVKPGEEYSAGDIDTIHLTGHIPYSLRLARSINSSLLVEDWKEYLADSLNRMNGLINK